MHISLFIILNTRIDRFLSNSQWSTLDIVGIWIDVYEGPVIIKGKRAKDSKMMSIQGEYQIDP
jgi:hypothetical protein